MKDLLLSAGLLAVVLISLGMAFAIAFVALSGQDNDIERYQQQRSRRGVQGNPDDGKAQRLSWLLEYQEEENRKLNAEIKRLKAQQARVEREAKTFYAQAKRLCKRWKDAKTDLDAFLASELIAFSLENRDDEAALIAPDPAETYYDTALRQTLELLLDNLRPRQRLAIQLRFGLTGGEPMTYAEIGREMGVITPEAVRRHINTGLRRLRYPARSQLKEFLPYEE